MHFGHLGGIVGNSNAEIEELVAQKGLEHECSQVKKAFLCVHTMGLSVPSLHSLPIL